jgi:hypothetical protein
MERQERPSAVEWDTGFASPMSNIRYSFLKRISLEATGEEITVDWFDYLLISYVRDGLTWTPDGGLIDETIVGAEIWMGKFESTILTCQRLRDGENLMNSGGRTDHLYLVTMLNL